MKLLTKESVVITNRSHIHGDILHIIEQVLPSIVGGERFIKQTIKFDNPIGLTKCVKTNEDDKIYLKKREGRFGKSRFVANREPEPCDEFTIILIRLNENSYRIVTAFVGGESEPEVWDKRAFSQSPNSHEAKLKSETFWKYHALIE